MNVIKMIQENRYKNGYYNSFAEEAFGLQTMIQNKLNTFLSSEKLRRMQEGINYYNLEHDIKNRRILYKVDGIWRESNLSNNKIKHPFYSLLVDQKAGYLAGNKWNITPKEALKPFLSSYLDEDYFAEFLVDLITDSSNTGEGWIQVFKNRYGNLTYTNVSSTKIIPCYGDEGTLEGVIKLELVERVKDGKRIRCYKIEYWDKEKKTFFITDEKNNVTLDTTQTLNPVPHFVVASTLGNVEEHGFGRVPFVRIKNNRYCKTDLEPIKSLQDDLDIISSDWSNEQIDQKEGIWIVSGGDPKMPLEEFMMGIKSNGGVKVNNHTHAPNGIKVERLDFKVNYESKQARIKDLKEDIFTIAQGVNTSDKSTYNNISGVALKMMYEGLDSKCVKLERYLTRGLKELFSFIIEDINRKYNKNFTIDDIKIKSNKKIIINTKEETETALIIKDNVSIRTFLENLPQVSNVQEELDRLEEEEKKEI